MMMKEKNSACEDVFTLEDIAIGLTAIGMLLVLA